MMTPWILIGAVLLAAPDVAPWQGRGTVELELRGENREPVAEATVTWRFLELGVPSGPESVVTDRDGRVEVGGLAEGRWHVEVTAEGYRSFLATVRLRLGRRVEVLSSAVLTENGALRGLEVDFSRVRKGEPPRAAPPPPSPSPSPPVAEPVPSATPRPAPEAVPTPPAEPPVASAPAPEEPAPTPAAAEAPTPSPVRPAEVSEPRSEPPVVEPAEAVPAAPVEPAVRVAPAPSPPSEPSPAVVPIPLPEAPPPVPEEEREPVRARSGRGCPDCPPGEWAVTVEASVAPSRSGGECPEDLAERVRKTLEIAVEEGRNAFFGPLLDSRLRDLAGLLDEPAAARVRELLGAVSGTDPACRLVAVVLPADRRFTGFRLAASDLGGPSDCLPGEECPIGQCRWLGDPEVERRDGLQVVWTTFSNRSPDRVRHAALTVYFER